MKRPIYLKSIAPTNDIFARAENDAYYRKRMTFGLPSWLSLIRNQKHLTSFSSNTFNAAKLLLF